MTDNEGSCPEALERNEGTVTVRVADQGKDNRPSNMKLACFGEVLKTIA
jgi:hypothetical protein